jgi:putative NADH-flavin reductase
MKVLVLGSTGATGRAVVDTALLRGLTVTAFARDPQKMTVTHPRLAVAKGDVLDPASLDKSIAGHDAVVFCVGPGAAVKQSTVRTQGARNTVAAMTKAGVARLVAMSGLGAGVSRASRGFIFDKILAPFVLRGVLEDQNGLEAEIRRSRLDWVLVRPGELTDQPAKGKWAISLDGSGVTPQVSRADVVAFVLDQLQSDEFVRRTPAIGY